MAAKDPLTAMRAPGRICLAPTDLSTAYPHGGTDVGLVRDVRLVRRDFRYPIRGEEFGRRVEFVDAVLAGEGYLLTFASRGWNDAAWNAFLPNTAVGTNGGKRGIQFPNARPAGMLATDQQVALLFSPTEPLAHPAVLFPAAIPLGAEERQFSFGRRPEEELVLLCGFAAIRSNANAGSAVQVNLLEDLDLTP